MDTKQLRQKILDLAIRGKLVPQDPNDEPASVLLERVKAEKERLIAEGKIKRSKKSAASSDKPHYANWDLPRGWEWVKLSDLASFGGGKTPSMSDKSYWENGKHLWVTSKDMKSHRIRDSRMKISDEALSIMTQYKPGTILIVTRSGILRHSLPIAILERDATINQDLKAISFYIQDLHPYIYYAIKAQESFILKEYHKDGTTVDSINFEKFSEILLPIPPKQEQIRIITTIEKLFGLIEEIDNKKKDLQELTRHTKSIILDMAISGKLVVQDPADKPAADLLQRVNPNAVVSADTSHYQHMPQGWCVCKLEDIVEYEQPQRYIVESTDYSDAYKMPVLTAGKSFVIGHTNETAGVFNNVPVIIFDDFTTDSKYVDFPFKVKSSAMKILHVKHGVNIKYIYYFMSITRLVGKTHKRYWISEYSKLDIPLPPYNEQCRIVDAIERINNRIDDIAEAL